MKREKTYPANTWRHPGGKLIEEGADKLSDAELLSILIGTGTKGKSAEDIANEIIRMFGGYEGMANQPLEKFLEFNGLGDVKIIRIAAAFEFARRMILKAIEDLEPDKKVIPQNAQEDVLAWNGRLYRAITVGFMLPEHMDKWINKNGENIHKIHEDKKLVISGQEQDDYIVVNGRLYRSITSEIKTFGEIDEWIADNRETIMEIEKLLEERHAGKNKK